MNEDPRDDWTLLGLAAVAVFAALCVVLAFPAGPKDSEFDTFDTAANADEAQWIATEQPGEEILGRRGHVRQRDELKRRRQADEAELAALVKHSEEAVKRSRRAAAELEASLRALRPAIDGAADAQPQVPR
jgi:hypothetical protein